MIFGHSAAKVGCVSGQLLYNLPIEAGLNGDVVDECNRPEHAA
jgi:hypothetical protein